MIDGRQPSIRTKIWFLLLKVLRLRKPGLFGYDDLLPVQPVPVLSRTIEQYLASCVPVKSTPEMIELHLQSYEFLTTCGAKLQRIAEEKKQSEDNYLFTECTNKYLKAGLQIRFRNFVLLKNPIRNRN